MLLDQQGIRILYDAWDPPATLERDDLLAAVRASHLIPNLKQYWNAERIWMDHYGFQRKVIENAAMVHPSRALAWHQDGGLASELYIRIWMLLTPDVCGLPDTAPTVELLPGRVPILPVGRDNFSIVPEALPDLTSAFCPVMEKGDALMFTGDVVHRTHFPPGKMAPRMALELLALPTKPNDDWIEVTA